MSPRAQLVGYELMQRLAGGSGDIVISYFVLLKHTVVMECGRGFIYISK